MNINKQKFSIFLVHKYKKQTIRENGQLFS